VQARVLLRCERAVEGVVPHGQCEGVPHGLHRREA
jgi:hypothetical protein